MKQDMTGGNFGHFSTSKKGAGMSNFSRILIALATILLPVSLFTPIWKIQLWAPQYPEGLEMQIWVDHFAGSVDIINGLNHYIGMANIEDNMFPEFGFLNYIIYGIIAIGILSVISNKKWMLNLFVIVLLGFALAAMVDMYIWGYKYGHNLDPHAAIKIEGESYQPPLIGYKQLLNFLALSIPDNGGYALFGSGVLSIIALLYQLIHDRKVRRIANNHFILMVLVFSGFILPSCHHGSEKISYGVDDCNGCGMKLVDNRFGCELVTDKGRVFKFDDINCMISYLKENPGDYAETLIIDFNSPGNLVPVADSKFLLSEELKSPMGSGIAAFSNQDSLNKYVELLHGRGMSWDQVRSSID